MQHKFIQTADYIKMTNIENGLVEPIIYVPPVYQESVMTDENVIESLTKCSQVAGTLGIVCLPDIHSSVANPIGSVVARRTVTREGIGPDINCGVRSISFGIDLDDLKQIDKIADDLGAEIPAGLGKNGVELSIYDLNYILDNGSVGLKDLGMCNDDTECIENCGRFRANCALIGQKEKGRGLSNVGSVGSGNHYVEVQKVAEIYDEKTAAEYGIYKKNQIVVSIHTGSRGFGFEVNKTLLDCNEDDFLNKLGCASNFAIANRSILQRKVVSIFERYFPKMESRLIYDVGHNNIKKEQLPFYGDVIVTRKGASRAYSVDLPDRFRYGQPVPVGGSMGTQSYLLKGLEESLSKSMGSICHGAGRLYSRGQCKKNWSARDVLKQMEGVILKCESEKEIVEEAPSAYKDINVVVDHCVKIGICDKVVKLEPIIVVKG